MNRERVMFAKLFIFFSLIHALFPSFSVSLSLCLCFSLSFSRSLGFKIFSILFKIPFFQSFFSLFLRYEGYVRRVISVRFKVRFVQLSERSQQMLNQYDRGHIINVIICLCHVLWQSRKQFSKTFPNFLYNFRVFRKSVYILCL